MAEPHHDSAAFLEVVENPPQWGGDRRARPSRGWYVRRTCDCHAGLVVSVAFATRAEAERCLRALDADCRLRTSRRFT